jgi:AcrR family transcriptional regulator
LSTVPALEPRRTPRQARALATQEAILEAAAQIISRDGLAAFTTNAVAERAGVSIGSLYQYFANKDGLMVALIDRQQQQQLATLHAALAGISAEASLADAVRAMVRGAMHHHRHDAMLATAIDHEEARLPVGAMLDAYLARGGAVVAALFGRYAAQLAHIDAAAAVRTLPSLVRAVGDTWANAMPPQVQKAEDEAVRAVLGYLSVGRPDEVARAIAA